MTVLAGSVINDLLDGGDDVGSADGMVDTLNFDGLTITAPDMMNWELTNVINGANVTFADDFTTETLTTDSASTAVLADALTITGDVLNDGTINMQSGTATGTATIDGNLTGSGTLAISIDVGADIADVLTVTGDSTGASVAITPNPISAVPATGNDVLVATVNGTPAAGDFTLPNGTTMQTINGVTYELVLVGDNWFLRANGTPMIAKIPSVSVLGLLLLMFFISRAGLLATRQERKR
ncbi:autotransporter outer membrane beta-barrel domain-containing protein [Ostreibacterium oceani]